MRRMATFGLLFFAIVGIVAGFSPAQTGSPPASPEEAAKAGLTNEDVIKMVQAKLGDAVIVAKIKVSQCKFDTSTDALIKLKQSGVSDAVLEAMTEAAAPAPPGPTMGGIQPDSLKGRWKGKLSGRNGSSCDFELIISSVSPGQVGRAIVTSPPSSSPIEAPLQLQQVLLVSNSSLSVSLSFETISGPIKTDYELRGQTEGAGRLTGEFTASTIGAPVAVAPVNGNFVLTSELPMAPTPSLPAALAPASAPAIGQSLPTKPYALIVEGEIKHPLPASRAEIAHAKSKWTGDSLQSAALDDAITGAAINAAAPAIASVGMAAGSAAMLPFAGIVVSGLMMRHKITETYIWAIPHATSQNAFKPGSKVELFYDDIPGVNPDEYQPVLVRLEPTKSNMRLVCAQKVEMRAGTMKGKEKVVLEPQAATISKLSPGHVVLEPEQPLAPGEYGVLLTPPKREVDLMGQLGAAGSSFSANEAALLYMVWDFTVQVAGKQ